MEQNRECEVPNLYIHTHTLYHQYYRALASLTVQSCPPSHSRDPLPKHVVQPVEISRPGKLHVVQLVLPFRRKSGPGQVNSAPQHPRT